MKVYGLQNYVLYLKPGTSIRGNVVVGNLPKGYLAMIGCDIMRAGSVNIDIERGELRRFGETA